GGDRGRLLRDRRAGRGVGRARRRRHDRARPSRRAGERALPGVTATEGMRQAEAMVPEMVRGLVAEHPIGRMATVDEIASAAGWLCSPGAGYVTAAAIAVDGGFLAA